MSPISHSPQSHFTFLPPLTITWLVLHWALHSENSNSMTVTFDGVVFCHADPTLKTLQSTYRLYRKIPWNVVKSKTSRIYENPVIRNTPITNISTRNANTSTHNPQCPLIANNCTLQIASSSVNQTHQKSEMLSICMYVRKMIAGSPEEAVKWILVSGLENRPKTALPDSQSLAWVYLCTWGAIMHLTHKVDGPSTIATESLNW